ncbi:MAG: L-aspartate oxidase [Eubacteriales bacterium]|nr:L-aspartate oxidase [Eubacteriales bacterium]
MEKYYDAIIVGTGVAGCFSALHLPCDKKILMITKAKLNESDSFLAQGGICVQKGDEDYDSFFEDTMRAGHYENRKESVDIMIRSSRDVIRELIAYGVDFASSDGQYLLTREGAHSTNRILFHDDVTGKEITEKLLAQVQKCSNITIMEETTMVDILVKENRCRGILLRTAQGELYPVQSDYVVWACGGIGGIYEHSTNFPHLTGDALAIALRHDIELEHVDYVQIHPTTLYSKKPGRSFLISESVRGEGAQLFNKDGERFVDELLPRDVVAKAIFRQMQKDHAPNVWLSFMTIENLDVKKRFPNIYQRCLEEGYDITKEMIPVVPAQHYFMGGVHVDKNSKTSMECLYAAGETSCNGVHGANRLASNSLLESLVFAERAALEISRLMEKQGQSEKIIEDKQKILEYYGINSEDYKDMKKRNEENKEMIWREIRKVEQHESDHRQVKCG